MITDKKALNCAETLAQFCKEQNGCQNCLFRKFGCRPLELPHRGRRLVGLAGDI